LGFLLTANGHGTAAIMVETGKSKTTVWRWQERFMEGGIDGAGLQHIDMLFFHQLLQALAREDLPRPTGPSK